MSSLHASPLVPRPRLAPALRRRLAIALLGAGGASVAAVHALADEDPAHAAPPSATAAVAGTRLGVSVQTAEWRELAVCEAGPCPAPTDATAQPRRERVHRARTIALFWSSAP